MSQGYKWTLTLNGQSQDYKNITIDESSTTIDRTTKLMRDGTTENTGYSMRDGDIGTLQITPEYLFTENSQDSFQAFAAGVRYDDDWSIEYDGVELYSGTSFYVERLASSGNIPGEAKFTITIFADGVYDSFS